MSTKSTAATVNEIGEFMGDLDGGQFAVVFAKALSETVIGVVDSEKAKTGVVTLTFNVERIDGTGQVRINHTAKYVRPTLDGKKSEEITRSTPMHVGKLGRLTLMPETQANLFERLSKESL